MTLVELLTPWRGGWNNIADDIREGWSQTVSPGGLGLGAAFGPRLLLGAPLSFVRYPLAWACKNPISSVAFAAAAFALTATYGDDVRTRFLHEATINHSDSIECVVELLGDLFAGS